MAAKSQTANSLKELCKSLEDALLAARSGDGNHPSAVAEAYRFSRDIRDLANSIGYPLLGMIATNLCRIFEVAGKAKIRCPQQILDCHFEALRLAQTPAYERMQPAELPQLAMGLQQIVQIVKTNAARAGAATKVAP